ncbi:MAG: hypothetical protein AAGB04_00285 [Pseudomonadota bacterium]
MARISRTILVQAIVEVDFDEEIMPDDDWREQFYRHIDDHDSLAEHFAENHVKNHIEKLTQLDGFADRADHEMSCVVDDWDAYPV